MRALEAGWSREKIGSHIVRNNTIFNCEQTGICGSLGAVFSQITNNHIYNIWTKRQFTGAEMAGIKLHAAIDVVIKNNRIHNAGRGLWMDWMAQGTRITGNLLLRQHARTTCSSRWITGRSWWTTTCSCPAISLRDMSEGGAYVHNLMTGRIVSRPELRRSTPYHQAHSTALAGLSNIEGGDNRFYNNIFVGGADRRRRRSRCQPPARSADSGCGSTTTAEFPLQTGGNVYYNGARPYAKEANPLTLSGVDPKPEIVEEGDGVYLRLTLARRRGKRRPGCVTTELLGKAKIPGLALRECRRFARGHRLRLLRQETQCQPSLRRTFRETRPGRPQAQGLVSPSRVPVDSHLQIF